MGKKFSTLKGRKKQIKDERRYQSTQSLPANLSSEIKFDLYPESSKTSKRTVTKAQSLTNVSEISSANEWRFSDSRTQRKQTYAKAETKQSTGKSNQPYAEGESKKQQKRSIPPTPRQANERVYSSTAPQQTATALYDYQRIYEDDIVFKRGDKMVILSNEEEDSHWRQVLHLDSNTKGCVPNNYLAIDDDKTDNRDYYFDLSRDEAEQQLLILPGNEPGTYLIRPNSAESDTTSVLSLLYEGDDGNLAVVHYKICKTNENFYYIANRRDTTKQIPFSEIRDLINYFTENVGLVCRLTKPCPKQLSIMTLRNFEVDRQDIEFGEELGSGNFGKVYAGKFRNRIDIAIKELKTGSAMSPEEFQQEAKTMHQLRHPRLVRLLGVCTTGSPACIIMERLSKGSLINVLRGKDAKRHISFAILMRMAYQIADGMSYLEEKNFVHRDLRAANILVGDNNLVKIGDFGLAHLLDYYYRYDRVYKETKAKTFPVKWTALEAMKKQKYSTKSDVWSFGILLYELITYGVEPYYGFSNPEVIEHLEDGKRLQKPKKDDAPCCPEELYEIMKQCWDNDPNKRPTFVNMKKKLSNVLLRDDDPYRTIEIDKLSSYIS